MCLITKKWRSLPITDQTGGCRFARSIFSPTFCSNCGRLCFCCSASFECKGFFQLHDRCCPFSDLAADLPMRVLPEAPAMIAGFSTDHLPVFERSVNTAIRSALVGGSLPPANRPFINLDSLVNSGGPRPTHQVLRLFLEALKHK